MNALSPFRCSSLLSLLLLAALPTVARAQFVVADDANTNSYGYDDGVITPDGRFGIVRENGFATSARVYDMVSGQRLAHVTSTTGYLTGVAEDAVAASNTRAAMIGSSLLILDLTNLTTPLLVEHDVGYRPRDLEITPDGTLLVVRGGTAPAPPGPGGLFVFDLATGAQLATAPGDPPIYPSSRHSFDVDSVAVTDQHAVCTSVIYDGETAHTRVTIWDLHPAGGGVPQVVYETDSLTNSDQLGGPHDLSITPDGLHCAVRSELGMGCYSLNGAASTQLWYKRLIGNPGPFGDCALDSVEVTNERIATISRQSNPAYPTGAQIDLFDIAGEQKYDRVSGDPHDLAIDETGTRLVVRTHKRLFLYDLTDWPTGPEVSPLHTVFPVWSTHTSYGAGMDSVALHGTRVVSLFRVYEETEVYLHDFGADVFEEVAHHTMADMPLDVAIAPGGAFCAVTGLHTVEVFDMRTGFRPLSHSPLDTGWWPWCDGVAIDDEHALAFGIGDPYVSGWITVVDLFDAPTNYCISSPNSAGSGAHIHATGSASVAANDLGLWATGVPEGQFGLFFYGADANATPFGNGTLCVGGALYRFPPVVASEWGVVGTMVDYNQLPSAGAIAPGSTWRFQFHYRDAAGGGALFNLTEGLEILFGI